MTQLILNIPDNRLHFFIEQIKHFDFIQNIDINNDYYNGKEEILTGIKQDVQEMNLIKQGKLEAQPINELLNEL